MNVESLPFLNSLFKDLDVFIKGARDLVNRINAMRRLFCHSYLFNSYSGCKLASRLASLCFSFSGRRNQSTRSWSKQRPESFQAFNKLRRTFGYRSENFAPCHALPFYANDS